MPFPQKRNTTARGTQICWDALTNMTQIWVGEFVCYYCSIKSFLLYPVEPLM